MKRLTTFLTIACIGLLSMTMISCDPYDDYDVTSILHGTWHGSLGQYYVNIYGQDYAEWETEFRFNAYNDGSTSGEGIEIDYNPNSWQSYEYYDFTWKVANGNIYLDYYNGDRLVIRDYNLSDSWLSGRLETLDGYVVANLNLDRTSYWPWDSYYAKGTRATKDMHAGEKRNFNK